LFRVLSRHEVAMRQCFSAVTVNAVKVMQLEGYDLEPVCHADFVLLQARDPIEALRLRATRLMVFRRGKLRARTPAAVATLGAVDLAKGFAYKLA